MLISQIDGREYYFIKSQYLLVLASQGLIPVLAQRRLLLFVEENGSVDSCLFLLLLRWSLLSFSQSPLSAGTAHSDFYSQADFCNRAGILHVANKN